MVEIIDRYTQACPGTSKTITDREIARPVPNSEEPIKNLVNLLRFQGFSVRDFRNM